MHISHLEIEEGTQYTIDTIHAAQIRYPKTRFVFLMGADNFQQLPKWKNWQEIMHSVPIGVIARPGNGLKPRLGRAARMFSEYRLGENDAHILQFCAAPRWTFLTPPLNSASSTAIRKAMAPRQ